MPFLSEEQLAAMAFDHKYASSGSSFLDALIMQKFWNSIVTFLPLKHDPKAVFHWTAPNTMTLLGLFCMFAPTAILLGYCQDLQQTAPAWVYMLTAAGIFIYQTLDALDGKQARRTGSSSSFGELFDHGCDSISTILGTLGTMICLQMGKSHASFTFIMCAYVSFAGAHIQSYFQGCLSFGKFDVTEIQMSGMLIMLLCAFDANIWNTEVYDTPLRMIPVYGMPFLSFPAIGGMLYASFAGPRVPYAKSSPFELWAGVLLMIALASAWLTVSIDEMQGYDFVLFIIAIGLLNASHSCALIVAHMSRAAVGKRILLRFVPLAACMALDAVDALPVSRAVHVFFVFALGNFLFFSISLCSEISTFLGISIFKVGAPTVKDTRKKS